MDNITKRIEREGEERKNPVKWEKSLEILSGGKFHRITKVEEDGQDHWIQPLTFHHIWKRYIGYYCLAKSNNFLITLKSAVYADKDQQKT